MEIDALVQLASQQVLVIPFLVSTLEREFRDGCSLEEFVAICVSLRPIGLTHRPQVDVLAAELGDEASHHLVSKGRNLPFAAELPRPHHAFLAVDSEMASKDPFEEDRRDFGVYGQLTLLIYAIVGKLCGNAC